MTSITTAQRRHDNAEPRDSEPACATCGDTGRVRCPHDGKKAWIPACPDGSRLEEDFHCTVPCPDCPRCTGCGKRVTRETRHLHRRCGEIR